MIKVFSDPYFFKKYGSEKVSILAYFTQPSWHSHRNIRTRGEICSELTIKTPEQNQWQIINFYLDAPVRNIFSRHCAIFYKVHVQIGKLSFSGIFLQKWKSSLEMESTRFW